MDILNRYPELKNKLEQLLQTRRDKILDYLLETDEKYRELTKKRIQSSMALKNIVAGLKEPDKVFEEYSDAVFAQEIYELEAVYKQGFIDAVVDLYDNGLLN